jgi:lysophospholipase L1-like esterase
LTQLQAVKAAVRPTQGPASASPAAVRDGSRTVREDIEWSRAWVTGVNQTNKPRVLLIGDSITEGYGGTVEKLLTDQAYVARLATSKSLGDRAFLEEVRLVLDNAPFKVIHFNNGLHGVGYTDKEYARDFPKLIALLKAGAPGAKLIWATTTAKRTPHHVDEFDPFNERVKARNRLAREFAEADKLTVDDLFGLVEGHPEWYSDDGTHFNAAGVQAQARQVADAIRAAL